MMVGHAEPGDVVELAALFTASVHALSTHEYSKAQHEAWAPRPPDLTAWHARLQGVRTWVARSDDGLAGFVSCTAGGHVDLLFTAPAHARTGVATGLLRHALRTLEQEGVVTQTVWASATARAFLERRGFRLVRAETVLRHGVSLLRFFMERQCGVAPARAVSARCCVGPHGRTEKPQ